MGKRAAAVNPAGTLLSAILDEAFAREPVPVPDAKERYDTLKRWQAYGAKKAKERGLGLKDVTATVRARVRTPNK